MRQKLQNYHKEIRKNQLETYFKQTREHLLRAEQGMLSLEVQAPSARFQHPTPIETEDTSSSEYLIYEQWKQEEQSIKQHLADLAYSDILHIISSILTVLKRVANKNNLLNWRRSHIYHAFLRSTMLSNIVKSVCCAERDQCPIGLRQELSKTAVGVLKYALAFEGQEFPEDLFWHSDLLPFLRICISQPALDKDHLNRLMIIMTHMIVVSTAASGKLFEIMNTPSSAFNFSAPFYALSKLNLHPTEEITINFLIMIKSYLTQIQNSTLNAAQKKQPQLQIPINLTKSHLDICFKISIQSVHYYLHSNFLEDQEVHFCFEESLEVLRILIERAEPESRWLREVDYKGLINLLRMRGCPSEIIQKVFIIVDHLIYIDQSQEITFELVKGCELVAIMWPLKFDYHGYILNIMTNLATLQQFKSDIDPYANQVFLCVRFTTNKFLLFQFVYNWFSSQSFDILTAKDQLIVKVLEESTETDAKTIQLEAAIWFRLMENNSVNIPMRVLQHENKISQNIKKILMPTQFETV